ncbi:MAG TPA: hypothetical protein DCX34_18515 [Roseovarius sp.]|nr:hypothetical protein [Roseovarius sp.]|tara:strand:+ start:53 stop:292 length:240 start_codon:yes stop_codon:yes gene_type:complete
MTELKSIAFMVFPPIRLEWNSERKELDVHGLMHVGLDEAQPTVVQLQGASALQTLRAFRALLDRIDIDAEERDTPRGLQ